MSDHESRARPALSIVIPSCRRADLLRRCLASVARHAPPDTEIIVVDDASRDAVASTTAAEFAGARVLRLAHRSGFCVAVNCGIREARAPIVELLNDDTEVEAGWADAALQAFSDPSVVAVAPLVLRRKTDGTSCIDSAGDTYHLGGFAQKRASGAAAELSLPPAPVFGASASSAFYRRDALLRIGLFPESFGSYFEDVDVSFRLRHAGGRIVFAPQSRVWHYVHGSYGRPDRRLLEQQSRNEERVFWRNMPARLLLRAIPLHCAVLAAKACRRLLDGTMVPFLIGRLRAFAELRSLWQQRPKMTSHGTELPLDMHCLSSARRV